MVALWHGSRDSGIPTVSVDNRSGTSAIVDHLVQLGHERIGFAGPCGRLGDITEREDAFVATVHGHGLATPDEYRRDAANTYAGGATALVELMALPAPPTAIVAPTDVLAIGMLYEAHQRGLRLPKDLSITGFDDIAAAAYTVPALTTVRMPTNAMLLAAVDLAIGREEVVGDFHPLLEPDLVVRDSTGPAPAR